MRDIEKLLEDYKPLILSIYRRFHPMFNNREDKEDLMATIKMLFTRLVFEYDLHRGVDFPYYIKRMLQLRTYHYVDKTLKQQNREVLTEGFTNGDINFVDDVDNAEDIQRIIDLLSWNDDFKLGKKQKQLFIGLLQNKTLKEMAEEEGVDVSILHTRMHFLIKKLKQHREEQEKLEREDD